MPAKICILLHPSDQEKLSQAEGLADRLNLPLLPAASNNYDYSLVYTDYCLELQQNPGLSKSPFAPLRVDFLSGENLAYRLTNSSVKDPLARAAGVKAGVRPVILDATAGLGNDGMSLAYLGCKVTLIERSAVIHALLQDGIKRAMANPIFAAKIGHNIRLLRADAIDAAADISPRPDCVLVDPMYPDCTKKRLSRKEMRIFREVAGCDNDHSKLFTSAITAARQRVVVKRSKNATPICKSPPPDYQIKMKSGRFDIYLISHL